MKLVANYANVAIRLAFYHAAREEYAEALPMLELARKFYSETSDSLSARYLQQISVMDREIGRMALQAGDYDKAKEALERALTQTNSPDLYYFLGEAYLQSGDSARALSYYEEAYRAMPGEFAVVKRLATLYAARGETVRARTALQNWLNQPRHAPIFEEEARKMLQQLSSEGEE
ncbi:MAG: tetratricopeptide repeat protein [Candidatus Hydrothermae bacterium]|nr:tetratricopeptide repeat protein [Candidatus Hydrothermae bacterium]